MADESTDQLIENINLIRDVLVEYVEKNHKLTDIQKKILYGRFGLDGNEPQNIKELSQDLEIAPSLIKKEVDNLEKNIFNKLKKLI